MAKSNFNFGRPYCDPLTEVAPILADPVDGLEKKFNFVHTACTWMRGVCAKTHYVGIFGCGKESTYLSESRVRWLFSSRCPNQKATRQ